MRGLLADELLPIIRQRIERESGANMPVIRSRTLRTTGIAESALADLLGDMARGVDGCALAFLPSVESVDLRLTIRGVTAAEADSILEQAAVKLRNTAGRYVYGEDGADLAEVVLSQCRSRDLKIAVA